VWRPPASWSRTIRWWEYPQATDPLIGGAEIPIHPGHREIEQDDARVGDVRQPFKRLSSITCGHDAAPVLFQEFGKAIAGCRIVLDNQQGFHSGHHKVLVRTVSDLFCRRRPVSYFT
jgi:hypothetical protein